MSEKAVPISGATASEAPYERATAGKKGTTRPNASRSRKTVRKRVLSEATFIHNPCAKTLLVNALALRCQIRNYEIV
jgi:hypothetical protein